MRIELRKSGDLAHTCETCGSYDLLATSEDEPLVVDITALFKQYLAEAAPDDLAAALVGRPWWRFWNRKPTLTEHVAAQVNAVLDKTRWPVQSLGEKDRS